MHGFDRKLLSETPYRLIWTFNGRKSKYFKFLFSFSDKQKSLKERKFSIFFVNILVRWSNRTEGTRVNFGSWLLCNIMVYMLSWRLSRRTLFIAEIPRVIYFISLDYLPTLSYFQETVWSCIMSRIEHINILCDPIFKRIPSQP